MTVYLLDANVLIRAHADYYPLDRIPQFWDWLLTHADGRTIKMPVQIYGEVCDSPDLLGQWLKRAEVKRALVLDEATDLATVRKVMAIGYAPDLSDVEIEQIGRDPFLIAAAARTPDRIVVTREVSRPSAQRANRKVPDVCRAMGIVSIPTSNSGGHLRSRSSRCRTRVTEPADLRWSRNLGQVVKLGSPCLEDGHDDGQAEAVFG